MSIVNDYMFSLLNHMRIIAGVDKERWDGYFIQIVGLDCYNIFTK